MAYTEVSGLRPFEGYEVRELIERCDERSEHFSIESFSVGIAVMPTFKVVYDGRIFRSSHVLSTQLWRL